MQDVAKLLADRPVLFERIQDLEQLTRAQAEQIEALEARLNEQAAMNSPPRLIP